MQIAARYRHQAARPRNRDAEFPMPLRGTLTNENGLGTADGPLEAIELCEAGFRLVPRARYGVWPGRPEALWTVAPLSGKHAQETL